MKLISPNDLEKLEQLLNGVLSDDNHLTRVSLPLLRAGGKRFRASLLINIARRGIKLDQDEMISAAIAVELMHLSSLIHDDIIDNADERRGIQTINAEYDDNTALLAGDYLLGLAITCASTIKREVGVALAQAYTKMCVGQDMELKSIGDLSRTSEEYYKCISNKTAELIATSCKIGATLGSYSPEEIDYAYQYGFNIGMAYQIYDDLNDFTEDLRQDDYTLPIIYELKSKRLDDIKSVSAVNRRRVHRDIKRYIYLAITNLDNMENSDKYDDLRQLPAVLMPLG